MPSLWIVFDNTMLNMALRFSLMKMGKLS